MNEKERADIALVKRGLAPSRERAQAMIMAGEIYIGEKKIQKSSEMIRPEDSLIVRGDTLRYVSRGAHKLEKAVQVFGADLNNRIVMDIGASTGGFTDICLRCGAKHVYAIDVGYGQLDWNLRNNPRVTVMERTNARYLTADMFDELPDTTVMDVSFISIRLILPAAFRVMGEKGRVYTLIKPQFEAGRDKIGKNGVVRNPETHMNILKDIIMFAENNDLHVYQLDYSPITGPEGNIEFLAEIYKKTADCELISDEQISAVVSKAHRTLLHGSVQTV